MLKRVANILKEALEWTEGCACHDKVRHDICTGEHYGGLKVKGNSPLARARKDIVRCPIRGRRCPELAVGDFDVFIVKLFGEQALELQ